MYIDIYIYTYTNTRSTFSLPTGTSLDTLAYDFLWVSSGFMCGSLLVSGFFRVYLGCSRLSLGFMRSSCFSRAKGPLKGGLSRPETEPRDSSSQPSGRPESTVSVTTIWLFNIAIENSL